jgi:hypothetical protein
MRVVRGKRFAPFYRLINLIDFKPSLCRAMNCAVFLQKAPFPEEIIKKVL